MNININTIHIRNIIIVFLMCYFNNSILAQETYLRISEKDCLNCFINISNVTKNKKIKYLFSEKIKGNRFKIFNESYFNNQLKEENVLFSDELYLKSSACLDDLSGLFFIYKDEILFSKKGTDLTTENIDTFFKIVDNTKKVDNLNEFGMSPRYIIRPDYTNNNLIIIDGFTQKMYSTTEKISLKFDFKSLDFFSIGKKTLSNSNYEKLLENKQILSSVGKQNIDLINISIKDDKYYLGFFIPSIKSEKIITEKGEEKNTYTISNNYNYFIINNNEITSLDQMYDNIYTFDFYNKNYYYTLDEAIYNNKLYKINQVIYSSNLHGNKTPLFSEFKIDHGKHTIAFSKYSEDVNLFDFQKNEKLNTSDYINVIQFYTFNNFLMINDFPYVVDIERGKKIQLEWESSLNKDVSQTDIKYKNLQLWSQDNFNCILFKNDSEFLLKKYDMNFKIISTDKLFFNNPKNVYVTKKYIYLLSNNETIYRMDNFL